LLLLAKTHVLLQNDFISFLNFRKLIQELSYQDDCIQLYLESIISLLKLYYLNGNYEEIIALIPEYQELMKNSVYNNYFYYFAGLSYYYKKEPDFPKAYLFLKNIDKNFLDYTLVGNLLSVIEKNKLY